MARQKKDRTVSVAARACVVEATAVVGVLADKGYMSDDPVPDCSVLEVAFALACTRVDVEQATLATQQDIVEAAENTKIDIGFLLDDCLSGGDPVPAK